MTRSGVGTRHGAELRLDPLPPLHVSTDAPLRSVLEQLDLAEAKVAAGEPLNPTQMAAIGSALCRAQMRYADLCDRIITIKHERENP